MLCAYHPRVEAGWHPDPFGGASFRHWDGQKWTEHTSPRYAEGFTPLWTLGGQRILLHQQMGGGRRDLRVGDALAGALDIPFIGDTDAHSAEGSWYFDVPRVMHTNVKVKVLPAKLEIGRFDFTGLESIDGTLRFTDGRSFQFAETTDPEARRTFTGGDPTARFAVAGGWAFVDANGAALVSVDLERPEGKVKYGTGRTSANILTTIAPHATRTIELPLLVLLGTFLIWWKISLYEQRTRG
jgi:hypothetical protein